MRLPLAKVYRAFPELDRFSDQQCEGFVAAAKRRASVRLAAFVIQGLSGVAAIALIVGSIVGVSVAFGVDAGSIRSHRGVDAMLAIGSALTIGVAVLAWFYARDRLVRRRITRIIHTRGACWECGYGLTGLPVGADLGVLCPECGHRLALDVSLGEIVLTEGGVRRFMPSPDAIPPLFGWLTPRRKKWLLRLSIGGPAVVVVLAVLAWGGYEWFLHRQAAAATAVRPSVEAVMDLVQKHQLAGVEPNAPDAWPVFYEADAAIATVDSATWRAVTGREIVYPDFSEIYAPDEPTVDEEVRARRRATADLALDLLEKYRGAGVYGLMEAMSRCRRAVRPLSPPPANRPLSEILLPELGRARAMARMNAARMKLAAASGERGEFISAMEVNLALARMHRHGVCLIERLVGASIQALTFEQSRAALALPRDRAWIDAMLAAADRQHDATGFEVALESEWFVTLDTVAWVFADPARARAGRYSKAMRQTFWAGHIPDGDYALGTFEENRAEIEMFFSHMIAQARLEPWQRAAAHGPRASRLLLPATLLPALDRSLRVAGDEQVCEGGLRMMLALEQFRCDHGSYPGTLDELVPRYLPVMLLDPWSGRAWVYRRAGASAAEYMLYSVGPNGTDDGGVTIFSSGLPQGDRLISPSWTPDE